jgi:GNAT superfamily N-acetyltransferase
VIDIKELTNKKEWAEGFAIMKQLRVHLDLDEYLELVQEAQNKEHYRILALYDQAQMAALVGYMPMTTLYYGRFIWVCDLVTDDDKRSQGYGEKLLRYVEEWAKENSYTCVALSSGLQRRDAHRFYEETMAYDQVSFVYKKNL